MERKNFELLALVVILAGIVLLPGCGPKEAQGTATGAALGGLAGAVLAGDDDRGTGIAAGAAIGGFIGGRLGQKADAEDTAQKHQEEVNELKREKRQLQRQLTKWCESCGKRVNLRGAQSCPDCGGKLIQEQFCNRCKSTFNPGTGYQYCPYCSETTELISR